MREGGIVLARNRLNITWEDTSMGFVDAVKNGFANYANANGRACRSEFWYWTLFNFIVQLIATLIVRATDMSFISLVAGLALTFPSVCVGIRRLHDIGMSGWFYLISFIPLVGTILMIVWGVRDSQPGTNQYGPNPKEGFGGMY